MADQASTVAESLENGAPAPQERRKMGRPSKYTPECVESILSYLRGGNTRRASSEASGISNATFCVWIAQYPDFLEQVTHAEAEAEATIVRTVVQAAATGQWGAATWWLERRRPADWAKRQTIEVITHVRELARATGQDEEAAVQQAEQMLREIRSAARA